MKNIGNSRAKETRVGFCPITPGQVFSSIVWSDCVACTIIYYYHLFRKSPTISLRKIFAKCFPNGVTLWCATKHEKPKTKGIHNPLQCSRLENPRDGGAWWAAIYGVSQSQPRLKRLSSSSKGTHFLGATVYVMMEAFFNPCRKDALLDKWRWDNLLFIYMCAQACPTLCDPLDCSSLGFVHGILQAGILEWVAISFSRGSSWPRDWNRVSCIIGRFFTGWATPLLDSFPM